MEGGKSGLQRVGRQVIPGGRKPTESAAESRPPKPAFFPTFVEKKLAGKGERVR